MNKRSYRWRNRLLALGAGGLLAVGHAPFSLPYGVVVALPILAVLLRQAPDKWAAFFVGWFAGVAYFAGSMFWIVEPFFVEPEKHGFLAPFALIFLATGLALFWGAGFALAAVFRGGARVLAVVITWSLFEFLRGYIFTGFPWGMLAYVWSDTPVFQALEFYGPYGLGMITVFLGVMPFVFSNPGFGGGAMIAGFAALWISGLERVSDVPVADDSLRVRVVQPNAVQHLKWHPDWVGRFFERSLELSKGDGAPVDVVVWPETSIPFWVEDYPDATARIAAATGAAEFIGGAQRRAGGQHFNTLVHLNATGQVLAQYDKHHLVPFGEYVPLANWAATFGIYGMAAQDGMGFASGPGRRQIAVGNVVPQYLPLICYEAIFPRLTRGSGRGAWILHITNDAWFGNFSGPYQHLVQARARAIETGLPVVRAANTGVSAIIDPFGRVTASLPLNTQGYLDASVPAPRLPTVYANYGEKLWLMMAAGLGIIVLLWNWVLQRRKNSD